MTERTTLTWEQMRGELYTAVVCDALDSLGFTSQAMRVPLPPITATGLLVGRCKTTLWAEMAHQVPNPYELELKAVDECQPNDVLIAAVGGSMRSAIWGELLSTAAQNAGCVGAIVDGAVRDITKMEAMAFPVFARGPLPYDSANRNRVIDIDVPVEVGGVMCHPGDLVFADRDGVVVVPQAVEKEALNRAWRKVHDENTIRDAIKNGMKATEAYEKFGTL